VLAASPLQRRITKHVPACQKETKLEASELDVFGRCNGLNVALYAKRLEMIEAEVERDVLSSRLALAAAEILGDVARDHGNFPFFNSD
jgi:hypothetical protein